MHCRCEMQSKSNLVRPLALPFLSGHCYKFGGSIPHLSLSLFLWRKILSHYGTLLEATSPSLSRSLYLWILASPYTLPSSDKHSCKIPGHYGSLLEQANKEAKVEGIPNAHWCPLLYPCLLYANFSEMDAKHTLQPASAPLFSFYFWFFS